MEGVPGCSQASFRRTFFGLCVGSVKFSFSRNALAPRGTDWPGFGGFWSPWERASFARTGYAPAVRGSMTTVDHQSGKRARVHRRFGFIALASSLRTAPGTFLISLRISNIAETSLAAVGRVRQWSSGAVLAAREMAQMDTALATGLQRLRRPVIVHPGTLAEHVVFLIVSSFLDSASIFATPLTSRDEAMSCCWLALRPSITVSHCSRHWFRQPRPLPTLTHHLELFCGEGSK